MPGYRERQSNFELLRLVAMFLVLTLHGYGVALGLPLKEDFQISPLTASARTIIESFSIVCVNVFVLISGWFGIKPSIKGFASFIFQCLFFSVCVTVVAPLLGIGDALSLSDIGGMFFLGKYYYWFVRCYLCLYILAPVLNAFIQSAGKKTYIIVLAGLFAIQTVYGWTGSMIDFDRGYSVLSFVGLYLLARYVKLHGGALFSLNKWADLAIYIGLSLILAVAYYTAVMLDLGEVSSHLFVYINPLVIASALFLLLFFSKIDFRSKAVNYIARSAFAVYLLHLNVKVWDSFLDTCFRFYAGNGFPRAFFMILLFILSLFAVAILIDQIRLLLWKPLEKLFEKLHTAQ